MLQLKQIYVFTIPKQESMKERVVNFLVPKQHRKQL